MSDVGDTNFMKYVYRGEEDEVIPRGATHITVLESVTVILAEAFYRHRNIVEVICHEDLEKIERAAFRWCSSLRRVIMPGVKIVEAEAFWMCNALTDVACGKLEIIEDDAFGYCTSLGRINLPSARIVKVDAFSCCKALAAVKFGSKLERIEESAFCRCTSLERIIISLKDGLFPDDNTFQGCDCLNEVYLIEGELHDETIAALHLEEWRNDMNEEIDEINQILPTVDVGYYDDDDDDVGEKALTIRAWIRSVLGKINEYKAEHRRLLDEDVAPTLQHVLPQDIVRNNVLPFLELPLNAVE